MLEEIKTILINEKEEQLNKTTTVNNEIEKINQEARQKVFNDIDKKLTDIEKEIASLSNNYFIKIFSVKKIKMLYEEYRKTAESKMEILQNINTKRETLIMELSRLVHNSGNIEKEIKCIKQATTLEELGLTEESAIKLLRKYHNHTKNSVVQKVFLKIIERKPTTKEAIFRIMQELFQTNSSAFALEIKSISPNKLASDLVEIGITIDKDKLKFLNELYNYLNIENSKLPSIDNIQITNKLDNYYCNEIKKVLSNPAIIKNKSSIAFSQIMALSTLISIAKNNILQMENKKGNYYG